KLISCAHEKGLKISIQQLNTFDTIARLAHSVAHNLEGERLVHIRTKDESLKDCIILIPGAGGSIQVFNHLINRLDYPLISALQPIEDDLRETSIQALAKKSVDILCREKPHN